MKQIAFSKKFEKSYAKRISRDKKLREAYSNRYRLFAAGQRDYPLDNHPLTGALKGKRAFSVASDCRVVYQETADATIFLDIGSHAQVYDA